MTKLYSALTKAKDNSVIPLFFDGKPMHSKYNPISEAQKFATDINENTNFFIILGIGGGYHIQATLNKFPQAHILAIENYKEDLELLKQIPCVQELINNKNITFCTADNTDLLEKTLKKEYIPSKYGNLCILTQRAWSIAANSCIKEIHNLLQKTIKEISADFSVQSNFGKIWQHNIFANLHFFSQATKEIPEQIHFKISLPTQKIAAIIAAGPTLDSSIQKLKDNRKNYYIIATDTTSSALIKQDICPDAVVSIDGQNVSHTHFMENFSKSTLFIFDVCANPSAVRIVAQKGCKILFVQTGHPLVSLAAPFTNIFSGAGTVTIAAADFARKSGFNDIEFFGADFSYSNGKAYTKGTYLEAQFESSSTRINTAEQKYDALMFRTELLTKDEKKHIYTTDVLEAYRKSLETWKKTKNQDKIVLEIGNPSFFDYSNFLKQLDDIENQKIVFLPYIAYLRRNESLKNFNFMKILKLAHSAFLQYNFKI